MEIDSTLASALRVYERMTFNLELVRGRLRRPLTLADKLLLGHLDDPQTAELVPGKSDLSLRPDRVVLQDVLGQTAMLQFAQTGRARVALPTSIHCDHLIQARSAGDADLAASLAENDEVYAFLRSAAAKYGAGFWKPGAGIIHQVVLENYAFPGGLMIGADSHTPNAGGLGMAAIGVGGADCGEAMADFPSSCATEHAVVLTGSSAAGLAKDVIRGSPTPHGCRCDPRDRRVRRSGSAHARRHRQGDDRQHGRRARGHPPRSPCRRAHGRVSVGDAARRARAARRALQPCSIRSRGGGAPHEHFDRVIELDSGRRAARRRTHRRSRAPLSQLAPRCATRGTGWWTRSPPR